MFFEAFFQREPLGWKSLRDTQFSSSLFVREKKKDEQNFSAVNTSKDILGCAFQCQKRNMEKDGACNGFHVTEVNL